MIRLALSDLAFHMANSSLIQLDMGLCICLSYFNTCAMLLILPLFVIYITAHSICQPLHEEEVEKSM